tara:strand:+ start:98 stop:436 length:339 start_codon:yes stop_codon:yes gene_type:complete
MMAETTENFPGRTFAKETVTLTSPFTRGDTEIREVVIREPKAGELRGLSVRELLSADYDAVAKLLPRITEPVVHQADLNAGNVSVADLATMMGTISLFFADPSQRENLSLNG